MDYNICHLDGTNIWVLAPLCQEYQVDWLSNKIKSFMKTCSGNIKTLLKYIILAGDMNFGIEIQKRLVNKLPGQFQDINMHLEFLLLSRRMKIWITRVKLADLMKDLWAGRWVGRNSWIEGLPIKKRQKIADEVVSIFEDLDQRNIEVQIK